MEHYHYTNINHGHDINDPGHEHMLFNQNAQSSENHFCSYYTGGYPNNAFTAPNFTGITVKGTGDLQKFSSGSLANNQWAGRTQTDSNNSAAVETRPTNFTVKIWKRTA